MYYKSIIENVSKVFSSYFDAISVTYNFDIGSEFEIALCHVFTHFLPEKYGICRGFIVDGDDNSAGDDLIIYDKSMFRAIRHMEIADFSRKQRVPVEAVCCYIEIKNTIYFDEKEDNSLIKTLHQQMKVRGLIAKRTPKPVTRAGDMDFSNFNVRVPEGYPKHRNPPFTAIWAKQVKMNSKSSSEMSTREIREYLINTKIDGAALDFMVLGKDTIALPAVVSDKGDACYQGPFITKNKKMLFQSVKYGTAFGLGISIINQALNWIELEPINWNTVIFDAIKEHPTNKC